MSVIFDSIASTYEAAAVIPHILGTKLLTRLDVFQFQPHTLLDAGCGTGYELRMLQKRYPKAKCVGLDYSQTMLHQSRYHQRWWQKSPLLVCSDMQQLPFPHQQFDLIYANLSLLWLQNFKQGLLELQRVLKPQGLLLLTMLGPDTFKELKATNIMSNSKPYPWAFRDLHDIGDVLSAAKFTDIVMDVEYLEARYASSRQFQTEIQQLGFHHLLPHHDWTTVQNACSETQKNTAITWEIIYGQAWGSKLPPEHHHSAEISLPIRRLRRFTV